MRTVAAHPPPYWRRRWRHMWCCATPAPTLSCPYRGARRRNSPLVAAANGSPCAPVGGGERTLCRDCSSHCAAIAPGTTARHFACGLSSDGRPVPLDADPQRLLVPVGNCRTVPVVLDGKGEACSRRGAGKCGAYLRL